MEAEHQNYGKQQNRDTFCHQRKRLHSACKAAQYLRNGHRAEPNQDSFGKSPGIFRLQQTHSHRDSKCQRTSQCGGNQNPRIEANHRIGSHVDSCLIAAHVNRK